MHAAHKRFVFNAHPVGGQSEVAVRPCLAQGRIEVQGGLPKLAEPPRSRRARFCQQLPCSPTAMMTTTTSTCIGASAVASTRTFARRRASTAAVQGPQISKA